MTSAVSPAQAKACCAAAYSSAVVGLVLGESYHPGGLGLTRHLARTTGLRAGQRVLDVACGTGATARLLAAEFGVEVDGVDLGGESLAEATDAAHRHGLADRVRVQLGDAERLPFADGTFDAVVCECALCTFPDKSAAAQEIARVLRPGGRLGLTDVTVVPGGLPAALSGLAGWVACLADARPVEDYEAILAGAGLQTTVAERHDSALAAMVDQVEARLTVLRLTEAGRRALSEVDVDRVLELAGLARRAVDEGLAGYVLLVASAPEASAPAKASGRP